MKFSQFCEYLAKLEETTLRNKITEILANLFREINPDLVGEIKNAVYLLTGRVGPIYEAVEFGVSEKLVLRACAQGLGIPLESLTKEYKKIGDIGETVYQIGQIEDGESLDFAQDKLHRTINSGLFAEEKEKIENLNDVFTLLRQIATDSGRGSQERKINLLGRLVSSLEPRAAKYLIKIILGKLRLGFSQMTILDALSWSIAGNKTLRQSLEENYNVFPDLGEIASLARQINPIGPIGPIRQICPAPGVPILMARCERLNIAEEIMEKMGGSGSVEEKYDGFRLQVHRQGQQVWLYSRNLENVTAMYPEITAEVLKLPAKNIIFEGEAVGYNPKTTQNLSFQETIQRKRKYDIAAKAQELPVHLFVFDLLYLDDQSLLNQSYLERRSSLSILNNISDLKVLQLAPFKIVSTAAELQAEFDKAVAKNMEGIIVKKLDGIYRAGSRDFNWIKFKRGFKGQNLNDTIDCVIMGYDFGQGKRTKFGIGDFLIGIWDEKLEKYVTLAKIGTGLTDEEWISVKSQIVKSRTALKPLNYLVEKAMACDVWVEPKIVVEIKADEITKSSVHTAKLSLRFPRLVDFRNDKAPEDATSLDEINQMYYNGK